MVCDLVIDYSKLNGRVAGLFVRQYTQVESLQLDVFTAYPKNLHQKKMLIALEKALKIDYIIN
jgi:hypothetical protein